MVVKASQVNIGTAGNTGNGSVWGHASHPLTSEKLKPFVLGYHSLSKLVEIVPS
jgi:hypothetical protein